MTNRMTYKEALVKVRGYLTSYLPLDDEGEIDEIMEALDQESVLDKIMAEINTPNRGTCDYFIVDRIEEIINKYKRESEE